MSQPQYPYDLIAERDAKLKIQSSVIKWWNVRFVDADPDPGSVVDDASDVMDEEQEAELTPEQEEAIARANDIFARLEAEKAADEAEKAAEIAAALAAQEEAEQDPNCYNATTNSYSGAYGTGPISEDTAAQAASILAEKHDAMADLISQIQSE